MKEYEVLQIYVIGLSVIYEITYKRNLGTRWSRKTKEVTRQMWQLKACKKGHPRC